MKSSKLAMNGGVMTSRYLGIWRRRNEMIWGVSCFIVAALLIIQVQSFYRQHAVGKSTIRSSLQIYGIKNPLRNVDANSNLLVKILTKNPISLIFTNAYSFFYWFPREKLPYDAPWSLFRNSTVEWLQWYQWPHNLPPYRYLDSGFPDDFFCYGLPGNTLPLGNWDPFCFTQVNHKVVRKYRESELKHGRVAMLASVGFLVQEIYHPFYSSIGGLSITHMQQLREMHCEASNLCGALGMANEQSWSPDYWLLVISLSSVESLMFLRNWARWQRDEFPHQYHHNIGLANLKTEYENGNYGFDPLKLMPDTEEDKRWIKEVELNHCRLAMVAFVGMLGQEYFTGVPVSSTFLGADGVEGIGSVFSFPLSIIQSLKSVLYLVTQKFESASV
jgi:hypothetical protein